jgi:hypothetical protein
MLPDEPHWDGDGEGMVDKDKANSRRKPGEREVRKLFCTRTLSLKGILFWGFFCLSFMGLLVLGRSGSFVRMGKGLYSLILIVKT